MEAWDGGGSLAREMSRPWPAAPLHCMLPPQRLAPTLQGTSPHAAPPPSAPPPTSAPMLLVTEMSDELVTLPNSVLASVTVADWIVAPSPKAAPLVKAGLGVGVGGGGGGQGEGREGSGAGPGGEGPCERGQGGKGTLPGNSSELL